MMELNGGFRDLRHPWGAVNDTFLYHFGSNCYEKNGKMFADVGFLGGADNGTHFCLILGLIVIRKMAKYMQMWGLLGGAVNDTYFLSHFGSNCYEQNGNRYADVGLRRGCR